MKKLIGVLLVGLLVVPAALVYALEYQISAKVPLATSVDIVANKVVAATDDGWTPVTGTFDFGNLELATYDGFQVFEPKNYFVIDISAKGAGTPKNTQIKYKEGAAVPGATGSQTLGNRANISFMSAEFKPLTPKKPGETEIMPKKLLSALTSEVAITESQIKSKNGTWLRVYVGLNNGKTTGMDPFTTADPAGTYTGTLTVTSSML
jgi:hypothetical protein